MGNGEFMSKVKAIILAAGKGTRMKSNLPKVVHKINGKCLAEYVIDAVKDAGVDDICLVVGYKQDIVKLNIDRDVKYVTQEEQLGTGHAVMCAGDFICKDLTKENDGEILILCGDTPLITGQTLKKFIDFHENSGNSVTVLSAKLDDPTGYGRIIRDENGNFIKNVEHKDATDKERESREVNSGMYMFGARQLNLSLSHLTTDNAQREYYLPDTITYIREKGLKADAYVLEDAQEIAGVNTVEQLEAAKKVIERRNR